MSEAPAAAPAAAPAGKKWGGPWEADYKKEEMYCGMFSFIFCYFTGCWCVACFPLDKKPEFIKEGGQAEMVSQ